MKIIVNSFLWPHPSQLGTEEVALPKEEHINWVSSAKGSALKTYILVTFGLKQVMSRNVYVSTHTHRHAVMSERRDHELKENRDGHVGGLELPCV